MATLTHPEDTGTLDREAIQQAARDAAPRHIDTDELDRHAAELRDWLDAHGTLDDSDLAGRRVIAAAATSELTPAAPGALGGNPAILVHQHVWSSTPPRWEPRPRIDLDELVDEAFAPILQDTGTAGATWLDTDGSFVALPPRPQDERTRSRNRTLGWGLVVGMWAVATALLVPFLLASVFGSFDLTVDLGDDEVVVEDAPVADSTTEVAPG